MDARGLGVASVVDAHLHAVGLLVRQRLRVSLRRRRQRGQRHDEAGQFALAARALAVEARPAVAQPARRGAAGVEQVGAAQLQLGHLGQAGGPVVQAPAREKGSVDGRGWPGREAARGIGDSAFVLHAADGGHEVLRPQFRTHRYPARAGGRQQLARVAVGADQRVGGLAEVARLGQHAGRQAGREMHVAGRQQRIGVLARPRHVGNGARDGRQVVQRGLVRMRLDDQQVDAPGQLAQRRDHAGRVHGAAAADEREVHQALAEEEAHAQPRVEQRARAMPREAALEGARVVPEQLLVHAARQQGGLDGGVVGARAEVQVLGEAARVDLDVEVAGAAAVDALLLRGREAPADHKAAGTEGRHAVAPGQRREVGDAGARPASGRAGQLQPVHEASDVDAATLGHRRDLAHRKAQAPERGIEEAPEESPVGDVVLKPVGGRTEEIVGEDDVMEPAGGHGPRQSRQPVLARSE